MGLFALDEPEALVVGQSDAMTVPRWVESPDDDLGGRRMSIVRELVNEVSFDPRPGKPQLRFEKPR